MAIIDSSDYRNYPAINQSRAKLIYNPSLYKNYQITPEDDGEVKDHLKFGSFLDTLLLDNSKVWDKYVVANCKLPTDNIKKLIDYIAAKEDLNFLSFDNFNIKVPEVAKMMNYGQTWKPETLIEKVWKEGKDYYNFLLSTQNKIVLSNEEYDLGLYNYIQLEGLFKSMMPKVCLTAMYYDLELKGELDYLEINHIHKTFRVRDLKTTADMIGFPVSIIKYRYDFQKAWYIMLVAANMKELGIEGYTMLSSIWDVASNQYKQPALQYLNPFPNTTQAYKSFTLGGRYYMGIQEALERLKWHTENDKWDYPMEQYLNGYIVPKIKPEFVDFQTQTIKQPTLFD